MLQQIIDAMDLLATGCSKKTNGKISAVNLAKEASISKATLYRYFESHEDLEKAFQLLRRNGVRLVEAPETVEQENANLKAETKALRSKIAEQERMELLEKKVMANQIFVLWQEVERLTQEQDRLLQRLKAFDNIRLMEREQDAIN